jgi:hypothetical protein
VSGVFPISLNFLYGRFSSFLFMANVFENRN